MEADRLNITRSLKSAWLVMEQLFELWNKSNKSEGIDVENNGENEENKEKEVKTDTAPQFWLRVITYLRQVEGKTKDAWLLIGQSWHQLTDNYRKKVQINFDENLDDDWKKLFKDAAIKIEEAAPGIEFITDKSSKTRDLLDK